jgi:hypothetical protein
LQPVNLFYRIPMHSPMRPVQSMPARITPNRLFLLFGGIRIAPTAQS